MSSTLSLESLQKAAIINPNGLLRLANFLNCFRDKYDDESDIEFLFAIANSIFWICKLQKFKSNY